MLTFYVIGVFVTLLISLLLLAWEISDKEKMVDKIYIMKSMAGILVLSLFSWAVVFTGFMALVFEEIRRKKP